MSADLKTRNVGLDESALNRLADISRAAKIALVAEQTTLRRNRNYMTYRSVAAAEREIQRLFKVVALCSDAVAKLPQDGVDDRCRHLQDALVALAKLGSEPRVI